MKEQKLDCNIVKKNLSSYANIKSLLGDGLEDVLDADHHPLVRTLSRAEIHPENLAKIKHGDKALGLFLKEKQPKLKRVKSGLINPDEYYPTMDEILLAAHFKSEYETEIQYSIDNTRVDCRVDINGTEILVEVISLDIAEKMKQSTAMVRLNPNRLREKILDKIQDRKEKSQIAIYAEYSPSPIFLAINKTRSPDIDESDLDYVLHGTPQTIIVRDPEGRLIGSYQTRNDDSITKENNWKYVSGLILFSEHFDSKNAEIKLYGNIHKNDLGRPVSDEIIEKMKHTLFDRSL